VDTRTPLPRTKERAMSESLRAVAIATAAAAGLLVTVIGLAAAVEVREPDWGLLVAGVLIFLGTTIPLLVGGQRRRRRRLSVPDPQAPRH
jgi:hypothetical protein